MRASLRLLARRPNHSRAPDRASEKKSDRMRETIDEYYAFKNEFPESKHLKEVENIFKDASKYVKDDEEMAQLTESILQQGVLTPLVVRPLPNDEYEVISGHRRLHACKKAGIEMIPAFIYSMDRSEAVVAMVDSNLHREKLLPSEKGDRRKFCVIDKV